MRKFVFTKTRKEVSFGDAVVLKRVHNDETYGKVEEIMKMILTPDTAKALIEEGIIEEIFPKKTPSMPDVTLQLCVEYLAAKNHWSVEKTISFMTKIYDTCSAAMLTMLAKAAAVLLDKKYEGHISSAKELWCVSFVDWEVHQMDVNKVKDFTNFAAFRCKEDAEKALAIVKESLH